MSTLVTETVKTDVTSALLRQLPSGPGKVMDAAAVKSANRRVFQAAEDSAEFFDHLRAHYRETRRTKVEIDCEVKLVLADSTLFDTGSAVLKNISPSGALVGQLKLLKGVLPVQAFKLLLVLKGGQYNGIGIEAVPVRLALEVTGLGVKFEEIFVNA